MKALTETEIMEAVRLFLYYLLNGIDDLDTFIIQLWKYRYVTLKIPSNRLTSWGILCQRV